MHILPSYLEDAWINIIMPLLDSIFYNIIWYNNLLYEAVENELSSILLYYSSHFIQFHF